MARPSRPLPQKGKRGAASKASWPRARKRRETCTDRSMTPRLCSILALIAVFLGVSSPARALPQVELRGADSEMTSIGIEPRLPASRFLASRTGLRTPLAREAERQRQRMPVSAPRKAPRWSLVKSQFVLPLINEPASIRLRGLRWRFETSNMRLSGKINKMTIAGRYRLTW